MSPGRMVAVLAAALCCGAIVAALAADAREASQWSGQPSPSSAPLVVAALLTGLVLAVQWLRRGSAARPGDRVLAAALVAGGLVVFPVGADFYTDAGAAAEGSGVDHCDGVLPLAQAARNTVADDQYAAIYYFAGCQD